ncbi:DUF2591 family protein [Burkholderia cepacia]|uniref:phage protein NinX family protein n=1 Tax=Burkholderia cepacia TaxID=292 RepID=UPI0026508605|nr:phage protein NinX family protein [Burkholderia cepacia]MDN7901457.1 DUF2591 family protein [Burkholderia cepacia]
MKSNIEGKVLESDVFVTHRKAWRDALLIVRNNGWLVGLDDGPLNWDTCIQAFDEAFALYALGSIPDAFTSNHEAWRLALTLAQDFAKVQGLDVDDEAYWEHEIRAFDRAFESVGIRLADGRLPEIAELAVENLQVGDKVDLNSCPFLKGSASADFEFAVVESVERETANCVVVSYEGHEVVGYPVGCKVKVSSATLGDRKSPDTSHQAAGLAYLNGKVVAAPDLIATLDKAESFIVGFEGDEQQEGVDDLLREIRTARGALKAQRDRAETPVRGAVGFYRPDPGNGIKSPNIVLDVLEDVVRVFEMPSGLPFNLDRKDWMSVREMKAETDAMPKNPRYAPGGPANDDLDRMLEDRHFTLSQVAIAAAMVSEVLANHPPEAGRELPEDEPAIESYCQQVCGGGECGAGAVCQHGIDPTTELPVASFDAKLPQATLVSSEHGFDDYDVTGIPTVHRVAIGQGIRKGESFNVYCDEGRKIGSVWQGTLEKSLEDLSVRFAADAAEEWNLPEIQAATIAVKVQDLAGVRLDWAVAKALGCELVSAHHNFRQIAKGAWSEEKITEQLGKMTNEQVIINPMSGNAEPLPAFSTGWLSAGPIIERERISTNYDASGRWSQGWRAFSNRAPIMLGETLLVAAMRSYVASKLGEEVAVPANLLA